MPVSPNETNPPLVIDSYRVLPLAIPPQGFQLVARRRCQKTQFRRGVQLQQFPESYAFEGPEPPRMLVMKKVFGFLRSEAQNHTLSIERHTLYVKQT